MSSPSSCLFFPRIYIPSYECSIGPAGNSIVVTCRSEGDLNILDKIVRPALETVGDCTLSIDSAQKKFQLICIGGSLSNLETIKTLFQAAITKEVEAVFSKSSKCTGFTFRSLAAQYIPDVEKVQFFSNPLQPKATKMEGNLWCFPAQSVQEYIELRILLEYHLRNRFNLGNDDFSISGNSSTPNVMITLTNSKHITIIGELISQPLEIPENAVELFNLDFSEEVGSS